MQHHVGRLKLTRTVLGCRVRGEKTLLGREENSYSEEHDSFNLQCGESLAIATNRIGEEIFGMGQLMRGLARGVETALAQARLVSPSRLRASRPSKHSES